MENRDLAFVLSTPRAGSTLLAAMLGTHSQILCPPEPWLLLPLAGMLDERVLTISTFDQSFAMRAIGELLPPQLLDRALGAFAATAYDGLRAGTCKRVVVDKTPRYYHILATLDRLFPNALQIWLRRNPLDTIASCIDTWQLTLDEVVGDAISPYTFDVTVSFRLLIDHFAEPSSNKIVIGYEDFATSPASHLTRLCSRLGVTYEPSMLEYGANTSLMHSYQQAMMGDKNILNSLTPHTSSVGKWSSRLSVADVGRILRTLGTRVFEDMGYVDQLERALSYAGATRAEVDEEGALPRMFEAYQAYARLHSADHQFAALNSRPDVRYTLLGQRNVDLQTAADERLRLVQQLDRQLGQLRADADAKERVIVELRHAVEEQRASISAFEERTSMLAEAATERAVVIEELKQVADERLQLIERLERDLVEAGEAARARANEVIAPQKAGENGRAIARERRRAEMPVTVAGQAQDTLHQDEVEPTSGPISGTSSAYVAPGTLPLLAQSMAAQQRMLEHLIARIDELDQLYSADRETEARIHELEVACAQAEAAAEARLRVIEEQSAALNRYRRWRINERVRLMLAPKLGVLYQYAPRPLEVPDRYRETPNFTPTLSLSIVTPSLNQGAFIERTLRSVVDQKYPKLQYVVQDGGSTDSTLPVLEKYAAFLAHVSSEKDSGFGNAINRGFSRTDGEIMAYLNSDDVLLPGTLHYVMRYFEEHQDVDVVYGQRVVIDEYDAEIGRWVLPPHDDNILSWVDYIPQETLFWRRGIWERSGAAIDEDFRFAIDWDLLIRFRDAAARVHRLPRFLGAFRVHPHQKTSMQMQEIGQQEMNRIRERCLGRSVNVAEIGRAIRPYLRSHLVCHKLYRLGLLRY